jgi:CRP-like cAMP-binding protein
MTGVLEHDHDTDLLPSDLLPSTLARTRTVGVNTTLYEAGNDASSIYLVHQGVMKAVVPTSLGRDRIADLYGPGDVLGVAAIEGTRHAETVEAVQESIVTPLDPMQAMNERKLREHILRSMARQLRRNREMIDDGELPVGARVTRTFLRLCDRFGQPADTKDGVKLPLALTHEDLASLTGSSRVTITRILGELRNEGALIGTRGVYIANRKKLETATDNYVMQVI